VRTPGSPDGPPIRVLLVDDAADLRLVVRKALERHGGFEVVGEATDGAAGVEAAAATAPDIVVLDLAMPGVDGFAALPQLRAAAPHAKVVVLSGLPPRGAERRARAAGAVGFLEKGIPSRKLVDELIAIAGLVEVAQATLAEHRAHLEQDAGAARAARRFVDETLTRWECGAKLEDVRLLVSELVTNAVIHAGSEADVSVLLLRDAIRVEVADDSTDPPVPRDAAVSDLGGRGLALVEALSTAWGVDIKEDGKVVWFEVPRLDADDDRPVA
jgi:DNA-binding NarL/FixJ family response regulator